ncbi:tail fiber protein [Paenibacillus sp. DYY-L-2]|uniref:tail fiber protein n=1 Tax=Paenibacillus sp. DYY-L-2 TaxID=3447013 RepID=UPI003F4FE3CE
MASNTPNLNLLKKDPVADGNDTFNIQTMLNENWDKIDAAVGEVREELGDIDFPLSDATNGTRSDVAASEKAVGQVMSAAQAAQTTANAANLAATAAQSKADQAFQSGIDRKAEVVAALNSIGVTASTSESWAQLIPKMAAIIKANGDATAADVLSGKTFSNAGGNGLIGSMPNQGAKTSTITTQGGQYTIPAGYHNGSGKITASFANLVAGNVKSGINIGGVTGTLVGANSATISYAYPRTNVSAGALRLLDTVITLPPNLSYISYVYSIVWGAFPTSYRDFNYHTAQKFSAGSGNHSTDYMSIGLFTGTEYTSGNYVQLFSDYDYSSSIYPMSFSVDFVNNIVMVTWGNGSSQQFTKVAQLQSSYNRSAEQKIGVFAVNGSGSSTFTASVDNMSGTLIYG